MPRLATCNEIAIWMYRPDHPPPHFNAQYGEEVAQIELATLRVISGPLQPRAASCPSVGALTRTRSPIAAVVSLRPKEGSPQAVGNAPPRGLDWSVERERSTGRFAVEFLPATLPSCRAAASIHQTVAQMGGSEG